MAIVTDQNVHDALAYLAIDPHPLAIARKDLTDAENEKEYTYAVIYGTKTGSVRDRETATECTEDILQCNKVIAGVQFELERHKARTRAADMLIEVWRSENANARAAEKVR